MLAHMSGPSTLTILALIPLVCWRMYARFKRLVGKQRFSYVRPWISLSIFPLITILLVVGSRFYPERLGLLAAGVAIGVALGWWGLRKTQFETNENGLFYTPNAHLGIALSLLMFARIAYRAFQAAMHPELASGMADHASTPLTMTIFGVLAGYYVSYAIGLLRWHALVTRKNVRAQGDVAKA
jgi:hypothetical protein